MAKGCAKEERTLEVNGAYDESMGEGSGITTEKKEKDNQKTVR